MEKRNKIVLIFIVLIFISSIMIYNIPISKRTISSRFVVGDKMGFDLDPGKLNFGQIVPGYSASREISIENGFKKNILINIKSSGEISDYIIVSENNFVLQPNESKNITFSAFVDKELDFGEYSGKITILSKRTLSF